MQFIKSLAPARAVVHDLSAALVVLVVSLPLCLGIAIASGAPVFAGIVSGIIGGVVVGLLSGSHTSVSGPSNSLIAITALQIAALGSFESYLLAVVVAGCLQFVMGCARVGGLSAFVPSSVVKGLLAAIGIILVMKQFPHLLGHDTDPEGEMALLQPNNENTFSELLRIVGDIHPGAAVIGIVSVAVLYLWARTEVLRRSRVPEQFLVVLFGVLLGRFLSMAGADWSLGPTHCVQLPVAESLAGLLDFCRFPDFSAWSNLAVYQTAVAIALIASLESLLSLEAAARIDPQRRTSSPHRELRAQGIGNLFAGLAGGIPITSVIVRSSVNINAGARTKLSAILQGLLILVSVTAIPALMNTVPLSCLAAILLVAGCKLTNPDIYRQMWRQGPAQFVPFLATVLAIVFSDLLLGVIIGLAVAISFILASNLRRPLRKVIEKYPYGNVLRIELANQVSFLNSAVLRRALDEVPRGGHVLLDADTTDYIDPDIVELIREFRSEIAPVRGVNVSLHGFRKLDGSPDQTCFVDHATRELQYALTPQQVLEILREGHQRFRTGQQIKRNLEHQIATTADGQHPLAIVLGCIDSRTPAELIFDLGLGDIFVVRIAGNVVTPEVLGSLEYGCAVAQAKLILVLGHTRCGAVATAIDDWHQHGAVVEATGCTHVRRVVRQIQAAIPASTAAPPDSASTGERDRILTEVATANVLRVTRRILEASDALRELAADGRVAVVGAMYDVVNGDLRFLQDAAAMPLQPQELSATADQYAAL